MIPKEGDGIEFPIEVVCCQEGPFHKLNLSLTLVIDYDAGES